MKAQLKYDKTNTTQFKMKLNLSTDADIINWLSNQSNKQGTVKELIRDRIEEEEKMEKNTELYILIDDCGDIYTEEYTNREEALKDAESQWNRLTENDKKRREAFYLIKSANPDEEAEDHLDGDVIKTWK